MNAKQLKSSILQFAMEGKIVEQKSNEEPVEILLQKIKKEKSNLIGPNKKKEKVCNPVLVEEELFEIPNTWRWVRINDIAIKVTDGSHNPPPNSGAGYQIISAKNITSYGIDFSLSERFVNEEDFEKENKRTNIEYGDLLLCIVGSIGKSAIVETDIKFTAQRSVAVLKTLINNYFLKYLLASPVYSSLFESKSSGTAQKGIYLNTLKEIPIPVPPIEEQQRIVDKIKILEEKIDIYNELYQRNEIINKMFPVNLEKAILQYAIQGSLISQENHDETVTELIEKIKEEKAALIKQKAIKKEKNLVPITEEEIPFPIPDSWKWVRIREISTFGNFDTFQPKDLKPDDWILDLEEIEKNTGRLISNVKNKEKDVKSNKYRFEKNDVLYGKLRPYLNKVIVAPTSGYCTTEIFPVRFLGGILPEYAKIVLMSPYFLNYANQASYGVKMPRMGTHHMSDGLFPLPPLEEQQQIVTKVSALLSVIDKNNLDIEMKI